MADGLNLADSIAHLMHYVLRMHEKCFTFRELFDALLDMTGGNNHLVQECVSSICSLQSVVDKYPHIFSQIIDNNNIISISLTDTDANWESSVLSPARDAPLGLGGNSPRSQVINSALGCLEYYLKSSLVLSYFFLLGSQKTSLNNTAHAHSLMMSHSRIT
jgi:hypothetical protein